MSDFFLDPGLLSTVALLLLVMVSAMILFGATRISRSATDRFASIPLSDEIEDPRS
jgi:cytochrome c oxidase cbb3-type subunit IV